MRIEILKNQWQNLGTLISAKGESLESGKRYQIQNVGNQQVQITTGTKPSAKRDGFVVSPYDKWVLIKGDDDVWVKAISGDTVINIAEIVEE